jgi:MATE family multidrug resistance protein
MLNAIKNRWHSPAGFKEVLILALPLILSCSAHTVQMFIDRMFLSWYDLDMMPAAMQAGVMNFTFAALFLGTAGYTNTFVAQYNGAGKLHRIGPAVWQGIYFSIISGLLCLLLIFIAEPLMAWMDHDPAIRVHELVYFKVLCWSMPALILNAAISSFYTGRGKTWIIFNVNVAGSLTNVVLDYLLIFGKFSFPEMGIKGAAIGTVIATYLVTIIYCILFLSPKNEHKYHCVSGGKFDGKLFSRLMRFGLPSGTQFMLDILSFSIFVVFLGRLGKVAQTASAMTFSLNHLAFMPMIGLAMAVSIIVGNYLGKDNPKLARKGVWSAFYICLAYMICISIGYLFFPYIFLFPFKANADPQQFAAVQEVARKLLMFVAAYSIIDTGCIIFSAGLKGAGDTKFVMMMSVSLHWVLLVIPAWCVLKLGMGIYSLWMCLTSFIFILSVAFWMRFVSGKWETMRVIEKSPPPTPMEIPTPENNL